MPYRKKLIEVALPLDAINAESAHEKNLYRGFPATLHPWWSRKPLAACRAVLFSSLVDDPAEPAAPLAYLDALDAQPKPEPLPLLWDGMTVAEQRRERLFAFIARLVKWENSNDERIIDAARNLINLACEGNPPTVLDPFCGGGSIPLEAQRLGMEARASDLNPVAVLITKALIEIPPKFAGRPPVNPEDGEKAGGGGAWPGATGLAADVRYYGNWMRDEAERRTSQMYPKATLEDGGEATVLAWLWARTVKCPNPACSARMPLASKWALSTKPGKQAWVEPIVDRSVTPPVMRFRVRTQAGEVPEGTKQPGKSICLACGTSLSDAILRGQAALHGVGSDLMAIVAERAHGRIYLDAAKAPAVYSDRPDVVWLDEPMSANPRWFSPPGYGMPNFSDLFTARQLMALTTLSDLVNEAGERAQRDSAAVGFVGDDVPLEKGGTGVRAYGEAVQTLLGVTVSKAARFLNTQSAWRPDEGKLSRSFTRQAIPMVWDFAEVNPFARAGGDFGGLVEGTAAVLDRLPTNARGSTSQEDSALHSGSSGEGLICTDPPYYDNVGFADISDFFYVWLRHSLQSIYPDLFATLLVPKAGELVATPHRFGGSRQKAQESFREGLGRALHQLHLVQSPDFPLTVFYAFKQSESSTKDSALETASTGWEAVLMALIAAGFQINGTWPSREGGTRMNARGTNALASSIVLVCRPRPENAPTASRGDFLEKLGLAMRSALPLLASGSVAPVDLAQASIGPGMAVYSEYTAVIRQDGRRVSVREALQDINNAIAAYRSERVSSFGGETRFCMDWYQQHGYAEGPYGDADNLARAYNVGPEAMQRDGLLTAARGKVSLERPASYPVGVAGLADRSLGGSTWEDCMRLAVTLEQEGETGAAQLARDLGEGVAARARELAVWLYTIADSKKLSEDAFLFNALNASWGGIQAEIARRAPGEQSSF